METQVIPTQNNDSIQDSLGIVCLYLGAPVTLTLILGIFGLLIGLPLAWYLTRFRLARRVAFWLNAILLPILGLSFLVAVS